MCDIAVAMLEESLEKLSRRLRHFGEVECPNQSPLYAVLTKHAAGDEFVLRLAAARRAGQPPANILMAAVHQVLNAGAEHPLRRFYPGLTADPLPANEAGPHFSDFCRAYDDQLRPIIETRIVQTNEVRRSACLALAFCHGAAQKRSPGSPLALHFVEVGASAGFNLLWGRFRFHYGRAQAGPADASLVLHCKLLGDGSPTLDGPLPTVASGCGIDLNPLDVTSDEDMAWLRALIWPEQGERVARLQEAVAIARRDPPPMLAGDAQQVLSRVLAGLPSGEPACVFHAFTLNQFSSGMRQRFEAALRQASAERPVLRVGFEWTGEAAEITVGSYANGDLTASDLVAHADPHGAWIRWLL